VSPTQGRAILQAGVAEITRAARSLGPVCGSMMNRACVLTSAILPAAGPGVYSYRQHDQWKTPGYSAGVLKDEKVLDPHQPLEKSSSATTKNLGKALISRS
jgi:hypothetical protein